VAASESALVNLEAIAPHDQAAYSKQLIECLRLSQEQVNTLSERLGALENDLYGESKNGN